MREKELMVYRDFGQDGKLLSEMAWISRHFQEKSRKARTKLYACMGGLLELGGSHGFYGNLWHCYLSNLLVNHENSYSRACEIRGAVEGTVNAAVLHDIAIFRELFTFDFAAVSRALQVPEFGQVLSYEGNEQESRVYNTRIRDRMTEDGAEAVVIEPILNIAHVKLSDLVGYETAKKKLVENTEAFVSGRKANNCLLYGDAGTGKSSSIKAIANEYYDRGLRIIEVYRHQFRDLNDVIAQIKNRNYKFIIYMDDLSFEDFETEYKYLRAVIEGGLEKKPDNVLIYATSNRRHLIREKFSDKRERDEDLHTNDTVQEKLSLVYRFGVTIYFGAPDKAQFQQIVKALAQRANISLPEEELLAEANKWELFHGGLSGRTAQQFIDYLSGTL